MTSASSATVTPAAGWRDKLGAGTGEIVDHATGEVLGSHGGAFGFTIGQRKGLRIGRPAEDGKPRYVLDIEPVSGTVTVGPRDALTVDRISGIRPRWCTRSRASSSAPCSRAPRRRALAVVRVEADPAPGAAEVTIELLDSAQGIAPGQAAVVYDGSRVVGSCTISATARSAALAGRGA